MDIKVEYISVWEEGDVRTGAILALEDLKLYDIEVVDCDYEHFECAYIEFVYNGVEHQVAVDHGEFDAESIAKLTEIFNKVTITQLQLNDILALDGIVIRKIPKQTISRWTFREGVTLKDNEKIVSDDNGREYIERTVDNKLAGYIVTVNRSQDSTVRFNSKRDGIGSTIEEAYADLINKTNKS